MVCHHTSMMLSILGYASDTRCLDMNNYGKKQKQKRLELRNFKCLQIPKLHELQRLKGRCILDSQI